MTPTSTPASDEAMRAEFEALYRTKVAGRINLQRHTDGYEDDHAHIAWVAWQAATQSASARIAELDLRILELEARDSAADIQIADLEAKLSTAREDAYAQCIEVARKHRNNTIQLLSNPAQSGAAHEIEKGIKALKASKP